MGREKGWKVETSAQKNTLNAGSAGHALGEPGAPGFRKKKPHSNAITWPPALSDGSNSSQPKKR